MVAAPPGARRHPGVVVLALAVLLGGVVVPSASLVQALTYPGEASTTVRLVEWAREHGGGGIVDLVENWWYARPPVVASLAPADLPAPPTAVATGSPPVLAPLVPALPGEGQWVAGASSSLGEPAIYTTFERPDARHRGVVVGVALLESRAIVTHLIAGTRQPLPQTRADDARVPDALQSSLVATFNSGFKMQDAHGGFYADGHVAVPLRDGAASLVVRRDGSATVGQWGQDAVAGPDVVAVRQNLDLVVDNGRPAPGLDGNTSQSWGTAKNQLQYTWRSGIGIDASGNLVYVAGDGMNLVTLAAALLQAGAVRGMQLDIHSEMVDFFSYRHGAGSDAPVATKLLPTMPGRSDRYLVPDQRDFVAVTLR